MIYLTSTNLFHIAYHIYSLERNHILILVDEEIAFIQLKNNMFVRLLWIYQKLILNIKLSGETLEAEKVNDSCYHCYCVALLWIP